MKIRSIRPEFFADSKMAQLSTAARILYIGLWCVADDEGRGVFLPKQLEGEVFPFESVDFAGLWGELEDMGRVVRYQVDGDDYWLIPSFEEYQKPTRKYASRYPAPPKPVRTSRTPRVDTDPAHAVEVAVEVEVAVAPDEAAAFQDFHRQRARNELKRRGKSVLNPAGYAKRIADDPDFLAESERLYAHRACTSCEGRGFTEVYAPGAGTVRTECTA